MLLNAISQLESVASLTHVYTHTRTRAFFLVGLTNPTRMHWRVYLTGVHRESDLSVLQDARNRCAPGNKPLIPRRLSGETHPILTQLLKSTRGAVSGEVSQEEGPCAFSFSFFNDLESFLRVSPDNVGKFSSGLATSWPRMCHPKDVALEV